MLGKFVTFEGADGSGKSTNIGKAVKLLEVKGYEVHSTREPGGSFVGEMIRKIILEHQMVPMAELLLFAAARAQHIESVIKPAMQAGKIVVCDRFADSTYAYQGKARGYIKDVLELEHMVHKDFKPDYTLFFDITLAESKRRLALRSEENNRLDNEVDLFKTRVFQGYQERFLANPDRMVRIDAMCGLDEVHDQVKTWINTTFPSRI